MAFPKDSSGSEFEFGGGGLQEGSVGADASGTGREFHCLEVANSGEGAVVVALELAEVAEAGGDHAEKIVGSEGAVEPPLPWL